MKDNRDPVRLGRMLDHLRRLDGRDPEWDGDATPLSVLCDVNAPLLECVPGYADPPAHLRYPRTHDVVVETTYRRTPIERLAVPGPPAPPRGPWNEGMVA